MKQQQYIAYNYTNLFLTTNETLLLIYFNKKKLDNRRHRQERYICATPDDARSAKHIISPKNPDLAPLSPAHSGLGNGKTREKC